MVSPRRALGIVLLIAGILRAAALWAQWDALRQDPDAYVVISHTLAKTGVFGHLGEDGAPVPTAYRPPLYPAILSVLAQASIAVGGVFADPLGAENRAGFRSAVALLHWALGLITAAATYLAAHRLLPRHDPSRGNQRLEWLAMFAAVLVVADPILLQSSALMMTETLATALAAFALLLWAITVERLTEQRPSDAPQPFSGNWLGGNGSPRIPWAVAIALGCVLGLAYLCRPTFIVWTALLVFYLVAWSLWTRCLRPLGAALPLALITTILLGGWTLRNDRQFGHPIWATTHGGYTLLLGNNPSFYRYVRTGEFGIAWDPEEFFRAWDSRLRSDPRLPDFWTAAPDVLADPQWQAERPEPWDEVADDRLAYQAAVQSIRRDPAGFLRACVWRIGRLLSPMPQRSGGPPGPAIAAVVTFYCVVMVLMMVGALRLGARLLHPRWAAPLGLLAALVAVHLFYWTNMRMRAPLVPAMAIVAAAALYRPTAKPVPRLQPDG